MEKNYQMVRLETGGYCIRQKDVYEYKYMDLKSSHWWGRDSLYFEDCVGTFKRVSKLYETLFAKETEVDPKTGLPFGEIPEPPPVPKSKLLELKVSILDFFRSLK